MCVLYPSNSPHVDPSVLRGVPHGSLSTPSLSKFLIHITDQHRQVKLENAPEPNVSLTPGSGAPSTLPGNPVRPLIRPQLLSHGLLSLILYLHTLPFASSNIIGTVRMALTPCHLDPPHLNTDTPHIVPVLG